MQNFSDEQLAGLARRGDKQALELLVVRHLKGIYFFCFGYLKDSPEAEDAAQEVFVKVWKNLVKFDENRKFKPWLYKVAKNTCLDFLKKKRVSAFSDLGSEDAQDSFLSRLADPLPSPEALLDSRLSSAGLLSAMNKISPGHAEVLRLRHNSDLSFSQISAVLGQPLNTVKSRYRRGVEALRKFLSQ